MGFIYFWFYNSFTIRNYIHQRKQFILRLKRFILRANLLSSVLYSLIIYIYIQNIYNIELYSFATAFNFNRNCPAEKIVVESEKTETLDIVAIILHQEGKSRVQNLRTRAISLMESHHASFSPPLIPLSPAYLAAANSLLLPIASTGPSPHENLRKQRSLRS